jgi:hypothetical protein
VDRTKKLVGQSRWLGPVFKIRGRSGHTQRKFGLNLPPWSRVSGS